MDEFIRPPNERVGIFVDYENMWRSMGRVDSFLKPILWFGERLGTVVVSKIYVPTSLAGKAGDILDAGYEAVFGQSVPPKPNSIDIDMIVDMMDEATISDVSTLLVVTGDGDFEPAIRRLRKRGKRIVVVGGKGSTSRKLRACADAYVSADSIIQGGRSLDR